MYFKDFLCNIILVIDYKNEILVIIILVIDNINKILLTNTKPNILNIM